MDSLRGGGGSGDMINLECSFPTTTKHHHHHHHREIFSCVALIKVMLIIFMITSITSLLLLNQSINPINLLQKQYFSSYNYHTSLSPVQDDIFHQFMTQNLHSQAKQEDELERTLRKAVMKDNKTVIFTCINTAWSHPNSIFDLFLESFRIGKGIQVLLKHVVVLTLDETAHSRCLEKNLQLHCYSLFVRRANPSEEANFNSDDYMVMLWRRIDFLRIVLQRGYDFVFTDADVMWFRDPFPRFHSDGDFQIACDEYLFNSTNLDNLANGGFTYVKSNARTIQFYKYWYTGKHYFPKDHDQGLFNIIKYNPFIEEIGLKIRFLDTDYFSGFCQPSKDMDLVITMHANCCVNLWNKNNQLPKVISDWKKYISSSPPVPATNSTSTKACPWSLPRICEKLRENELKRIELRRADRE